MTELQKLLDSLIDEHRKLLVEVEKHHAFIKAMNVTGMDGSRQRQEAIRGKINTLEGRRKHVTNQLAVQLKIPAPTLTKLAELQPQSRTRLLAQRDELRSIIGEISQSTHVAAKVTGAVLGHLNTVVRILTGAMQQAGVYTNKGIPRAIPRIGVIETVG